jgi:hypothetical protein
MLSLRQFVSRSTQDYALGDRSSSAGGGLKSMADVLALMAATVTLVLALCPAALAATDFCSGGILDQGAPLGTEGPDLVITNMTCTVDGTKKPYNFHNVYIFGSGMQSGTLTFSNATMDFYAANILVQNGGVLQATGIGANGETLTIHLYGNPADPADSGVTCKMIQNGGVVDDPTCGVPTSNPDVWDSNKMDMDHPMSCTKTSQLNPPTLLPGGVDDCFYQYNTFDNGDVAGAYFGHKVLALSYGGTINLSGYKGAQGGDDSNPAVTGSSWMRLNATLKGGGTETSLQVSGMPADWRHGDYIVVTATDYLPGHAEQMQVDFVDGNTVNLIGTVANPHWGQTYSLAKVPCNPKEGSACDFGPDLLPGQEPADRNIDTRAAVGLLTRSIRIVSDGPSANSGFTGYYGAHSVVRQGFLSYQIQGVEFYQMGQGGSKGHYPVHFHMARQAPPNTYVKDSSMWDSMTRWITIHATQGVTLARNVGYKSIGHGFYLEDGTEADNVLNTNLGVFARAAVANAQNDRKVPGILAESKDYGAPNPYHSDWQSPTVFWIMNAWNEFQYNFASSAGTCGACYWLLPGGISGPSQKEFFEGYAGQQVVIPWGYMPGFKENQAGYTPLKKFVGNSCSTAMESFINVSPASACEGVSNIPNSGTLLGIDNDDAPAKGPPGADPYYPFVTSLRNPTLCTTLTNCGNPDPAINPVCSGINGMEGTCAVTTLERYTTSFNWAEKNFSAIWLRPKWFLVENGAITDVQQGGLTFVTGGGYTRSDVAQGFWSLLRKSALVGNTQSPSGHPDNPYAYSEGPFNSHGLKCETATLPGNAPPFCLSSAQGISYATDLFNGNQRLVNIYDGPSYQEHNAYLDIPVTHLGNENDGACGQTEGGLSQNCPGFGSFYALEYSVPADPVGPPSNPPCYLPNAAIAWKQSNGFFYPPAFHSDNLFFSNVDIRHFVIEPKFDFGTFTTNFDAVKKRYCTWNNTLFTNFTDIDRQTVLNDDDGSLTGLLAGLGGGETRETISVNEDNFFNAPKVTVECASDLHGKGIPATDPPGTANTSPYEYITTATIAKCGIDHGGCRQGGFDGACFKGAGNTYCAWGDDCGSGSGASACYGVPLYRQFLTDDEYKDYLKDKANFERPSIRMMGQGQGQRSTLTVNHGHYYIDDQVTRQTQQASGATEWNIYFPGETYYTYFIYAKDSMNQTYQMFVGYGLNKGMVEASVKPYRIKFDSGDLFKFEDAKGFSFLNPSYDDRTFENGGTGLVTINVHLDAYKLEFQDDKPLFCQPRSYCAPKGDGCVCAPGTQCTDDSVCSWGIKDMDCPINGCFAFGITLPPPPPLDDCSKPGFKTGCVKPPAPGKFSDDKTYNWIVPLDPVNKSGWGDQCKYGAPPN